MLNIREISSKEILNDFVKTSPISNFMQSYQWSEYQEKGLGKKVFRLGMYDGEELISIAICYEHNQTFGKYIYCSRGPILKSLDENIYREVLESLKEYLKDMGYTFLKIDPAIESKEKVSEIPLSIGFNKCINYVQPETPWMMDLPDGGEQEFLDWCNSHGMGKNYPTYIRKARREGVTIRFSEDINDWNSFTTYLSKSSERKEFVIHDPEYYTKQFQYMGDGTIRLAIAEYQGDPIAMLILSFFGNEVSCLYSCQTGMHTKLRGAMLLRWECMLQAQREGFKRFNSWSVLPDDKYVEGNPQYGYSNFKRGFGGYLVTYQRTMDYAFDESKYRLVRLLDTYRKIRYYRDR